MKHAPNNCVVLRDSCHGVDSLAEAKDLLQWFVNAHGCGQNLDEVPVIDGETSVAFAESCEWAAKELGFATAEALGMSINI